MNTNCSKCKGPMPTHPLSKYKLQIYSIDFIPIGFLCDCGHWNDFRKRKGYREYIKNRERVI